MGLMPMGLGMAPNAQKALRDFMGERHFLDWDFDVFKLQVGLEKMRLVDNRGVFLNIPLACGGRFVLYF